MLKFFRVSRSEEKVVNACEASPKNESDREAWENLNRIRNKIAQKNRRATSNAFYNFTLSKIYRI